MRVIDADKYRKDLLSAYDDLSMEFEVLDRQPLVEVISLDKVKQAREEIEKLNLNDYADDLYKFQTKCTGILDKLIKKASGNTADVKLEIKVPEEVYDAVMHKNSKHLELDAFYVIDEMGKAIANGTPLPEG